ncbi:EAL domain-containing protein [Chryseomicrobium palamuruense]
MSQQIDNAVRTELLHWIKKIGSQFDTSYIVRDPNLPEKPIIYVNEAFSEKTGFQPSDVYGKSVSFLYGSQQYSSSHFHETERLISWDFNEMGSSRREVLHYCKDGTPIWFDVIGQTFYDSAGNSVFEVALQSDITVQKQQESIIEMQAEIYEGIEKGYAISSLLQEICYKVEQFFTEGSMCSIMHVRDGHLYGLATKSLPKEYSKVIEGLEIGPNSGTCGAAAYHQQVVITEDVENSPNWIPYIGEGPNLYGFKACWSFPIVNHQRQTIGTFGVYFRESISPTKLEMAFIQKIVPLVLLAFRNAADQEKILHLAYQDQETGLANMNYFYTEVKDLDEDSENGFVAIVTPTNHPEIVDMFGREIASLVLKELGRRLDGILEDYNYVMARFTSTTLILAGNTRREDFRDILELLLRAGHFPIKIDQMEIFLPLHIGVVPYQKGDEVTQLIRQADLALSEAKKRNGEQVCYYSVEMDEAIKRNMELQSAIEIGLREQEFEVHLQPKVDMESGRIISFEALARWNSSRLGIVSPVDFIEATESAGKIDQLEMIILNKVLSWQSDRQSKHKYLYPVAVNISPNHFYQSGFLESLLRLLKDYDLPSECIVLELTESIRLEDLEQAKTILKNLAKEGIRCSIDDFGIGYSSLSYLHELPISEIKLDRSFISQIHTSGTRAVVQTIIDLADKLDIRAVAEGIETYEQMILLRGMSCSIGQGYYFYKPLPLAQIDEIIKTEET